MAIWLITTTRTRVCRTAVLELERLRIAIARHSFGRGHAISFTARSPTSFALLVCLENRVWLWHIWCPADPLRTRELRVQLRIVSHNSKRSVLENQLCAHRRFPRVRRRGCGFGEGGKERVAACEPLMITAGFANYAPRVMRCWTFVMPCALWRWPDAVRQPTKSILQCECSCAILGLTPLISKCAQAAFERRNEHETALRVQLQLRWPEAHRQRRWCTSGRLEHRCSGVRLQ